MARKRYSDEEKAACLAALSANGGNIAKTAREVGVPRDTLRRWARGQVHPRVVQMHHEKKEPLADLLEGIARQLLGDLADEARRRAADLKEVATAACAPDDNSCRFNDGNR
jgi:transposase-like protein